MRVGADSFQTVTESRSRRQEREMWVIAARLWAMQWGAGRAIRGFMKARNRVARFSQHANPDNRDRDAFPPSLGKVQRVGCLCAFALTCLCADAARRFDQARPEYVKHLLIQVQIYSSREQGQGLSRYPLALSIVSIICIKIQQFQEAWVSAADAFLPREGAEPNLSCTG
jgi:hypothetical protein